MKLLEVNAAESATDHFRVHPSAAPLKLAAVLAVDIKHPTLPRSSERGPIEAVSDADAIDERRYFRVHPSAAPLKQDSGV